MNAFKHNPAVRFWTRTILVAVVSYAVSAWHDGIGDWAAFAKGAAGAAIYALVGLLTPVEPFVGVNKPSNIEVPSPPAIPEK